MSIPNSSNRKASGPIDQRIGAKIKTKCKKKRAELAAQEPMGPFLPDGMSTEGGASAAMVVDEYKFIPECNPKLTNPELPIGIPSQLTNFQEAKKFIEDFYGLVPVSRTHSGQLLGQPMAMAFCRDSDGEYWANPVYLKNVSKTCELASLDKKVLLISHLRNEVTAGMAALELAETQYHIAKDNLKTTKDKIEDAQFLAIITFGIAKTLGIDEINRDNLWLFETAMAVQGMLVTAFGLGMAFGPGHRWFDNNLFRGRRYSDGAKQRFARRLLAAEAGLQMRNAGYCGTINFTEKPKGPNDSRSEADRTSPLTSVSPWRFNPRNYPGLSTLLAGVLMTAGPAYGFYQYGNQDIEEELKKAMTPTDEDILKKTINSDRMRKELMSMLTNPHESIAWRDQENLDEVVLDHSLEVLGNKIEELKENTQTLREETNKISLQISGLSQTSLTVAEAQTNATGFLHLFGIGLGFFAIAPFGAHYYLSRVARPGSEGFRHSYYREIQQTASQLIYSQQDNLRKCATGEQLEILEGKKTPKQVVVGDLGMDEEALEEAVKKQKAKDKQGPEAEGQPQGLADIIGKLLPPGTQIKVGEDGKVVVQIPTAPNPQGSDSQSTSLQLNPAAGLTYLVTDQFFLSPLLSFFNPPNRQPGQGSIALEAKSRLQKANDPAVEASKQSNFQPAGAAALTISFFGLLETPIKIKLDAATLKRAARHMPKRVPI